MKKNILLILLISFLVLGSLGFSKKPDGSTSKLWLNNIEEAMVIAKKKDLDILIDFTGSDWCGWCMKLDSEVFSKQYFIDNVGKHFVLVKLDFPRRKPLSQEQTQYNRKWAMEFGVQGFPTIILTDKNLKKFAKTGYLGVDEKKYLEYLISLKAQKKK